MGLGEWEPAPMRGAGLPVADAAAVELLQAAHSGTADLGPAEAQGLEQALRSDEAAWAEEFGVAEDVTGLYAERNVFRYLPLPVTVRLSEGEPLADLLRVVAAGLRAGSALTVSTAHELPAPVRAVLTDRGVPVRVEDDAAWLADAPALDGGRVRLIGGDRAAFIAATGSRPDVAVYAHPVTAAGRVEMLPFLHEQAVSITAHRFGTPNHLTDGLI